MGILRIIFLGLLLASCSCDQEKSNNLLSNSKNLDSNLRKALLKALTELENESGNSTLNFKNSDTIEKASASAISIFQRDNSASVDKTTETPKEDQKQIVVIQKSNGLQHRPITTFIPSNISENFITSASNNYNFPRNKIVSQNYIPTTEKAEDLASPSPTMETPTTEENEAKAEEVQFFSAPLVAAFTVHQDERGVPKSVEPIYKQNTQLPVVTNFINKYNTQQEFIRQQQLKNEHIQTQIALQEKQKLLEEQLYTLQRQQKEQQHFLYRQQQLIQEQQHRLLEQNKINKNNDFVRNKNNQNQIDSTNSFGQTSNHFTTTTPIIHDHIESIQGIVPPSNQLSQFNNPNPLKSSVLFQTSVSLTPEQINKANELPLNAQHLPNKNFNHFRQTSPHFQHSFDQLNSVLLPPHQANLQNVNYAQNVIAQQPPNIRIYRQEPLGNPYSGTNYNPHTKPQNFIIQPSVPLNVRYLRSNLENYQTAAGFPAVQPPIVKQQLSNLLHNSGINTGRHEDLDLISKILSYNHVGGSTRF